MHAPLPHALGPDNLDYVVVRKPMRSLVPLDGQLHLLDFVRRELARLVLETWRRTAISICYMRFGRFYRPSSWASFLSCAVCSHLVASSSFCFCLSVACSPTTGSVDRAAAALSVGPLERAARDLEPLAVPLASSVPVGRELMSGSVGRSREFGAYLAVLD